MDKIIYRLIYKNIYKVIATFLNLILSALMKRLWFTQYKGFFIDHRAVVKYPDNIEIGRGSVIGRCLLGGSGGISIGENVTISYGAIIETGMLTRDEGKRHKSEAITIGNGAWICAGAIVLGGANVPENFTVPAGAVYTKNGLKHR